MRLDKLIEAVLVAALVVLSASYAHADEFFARLTGLQEIGGLGVGETGAIRSLGSGTLQLSVDKNARTAAFTLTYSDVGTTPPTTGAVTQAHIHFGKRRVAGGIFVFFCTNLNNGPVGTPTCPSPSATLTGTFAPASVVGPTAQNVAPGDFDALMDALESNTAYANIHTVGFGAGEIRGQIHRVRRDKDDKHDDKDHGR
jgi:CHRD domain